jgi:hypothetical protein
MRTSRESSYIPVPELGDLEESRLIWRVNLPDYAPAENILVNVDRINKLAWLGGMESLRVSSYDGNTTQVSAEIGGIDNNGTATAVMKGAVAKAKTFEVDNAAQSASLQRYGWSKNRVNLNIPEIDERVARSTNLRDPNEWSKQLNKALKPAIRESSWQSLIQQSSSKMTIPLAVGINTPFYELLKVFGSQIQFNALGIYALSAFVMSPLLGHRYGIPVREQKHTLVPGFPIDRYLAVSAFSRVNPLIKAKTVQA